MPDVAQDSLVTIEPETRWRMPQSLKAVIITSIVLLAGIMSFCFYLFLYWLVSLPGSPEHFMAN